MRLLNGLNQEVAELLTTGGVGVIRTDTLYGLVGCARNHSVVERIYGIKQRTPTKPPIILIGDVNDLLDVPTFNERAILDGVWPGAVSCILASPKAPEWLTRGTGTVAYRLPANESLRHFLSQTGPLIAPSANPEGEPPASNIEEAMAYFGDKVDFYVDGGKVVDNQPSQLLRIKTDGTTERLR